MDVLDNELIKLFKALNENNVSYIMVGGFATRFHGFNRSTDDLDMWLEDTLENRKNLKKAFVQFDYGDVDSFETMQFVPGFSSFNIGNGIELDILTEMRGLENIPFNECLSMASVANLEDVNVPFLHINHLIDNKKEVNRPKDQIDIIELEKIRDLRL